MLQQLTQRGCVLVAGDAAGKPATQAPASAWPPQQDAVLVPAATTPVTTQGDVIPPTIQTGGQAPPAPVMTGTIPSALLVAPTEPTLAPSGEPLLASP